MNIKNTKNIYTLILCFTSSISDLLAIYKDNPKYRKVTSKYTNRERSQGTRTEQTMHQPIFSHFTSRSSEENSRFAFGCSLIQISDRKWLILTEVFRCFSATQAIPGIIAHGTFLSCSSSLLTWTPTSIYTKHYKISIPNSEKTQSLSIIQPDQLTFFKKIIRIRLENHTEHITKLLVPEFYI
jgi:hypothetical protein